MALLLFTAVLFILYSLLLGYYYRGWRAIPPFTASASPAAVSISLIIPARNEEKNIGALLDAIRLQTYPASLLEVIVVDDHSTDNTAAIVNTYSFARLLSLKEDAINSYKKKALATGIAASTGTLIVTTDADCLPSPQWLATIAAFYTSHKSAFIAAPVTYSHNGSALQIFQAMDFLVLQGITGAAVHYRHLSMCNGANLAYERSVFDEVGGFEGIDHIASGDDMLLMHKIASRYPDRVHYLSAHEAIVTTQPMLTWKSFFNQRIRWASKAGQYNDKRITAVLALVYLFNCCFPALLIWAAIQGGVYWLYPAGFLLGKTLVELPFVTKVAFFFNHTALLRYFFFFQPLHIIYTIISGLLGQLGAYEWKGRKVK
ncbi:MAG: glycosyltransferase [Bacteroidetes bacterium]|nr:glycosyltransferase [Bacteroidota bacterium]